jgi:hypothetical protein
LQHPEPNPGNIGRLAETRLPATPTGEFKLFFENNDLEDVRIPVTWGGIE